ncbi:STE20-like serine/threonine-protein kinase isoform X2 [Biomphalaria pfeifferi]|uniref:STE20-like serine/threonine-protein kinase isoform X2 n=1 Tax=Biomphalaria pfeifferi TaxID=112525 RepID=A0AAD8F348_BIOPF|nr:STE20-like serine/threonine-protein kinase isoform X2 [Biomphalaria pfeifferi]
MIDLHKKQKRAMKYKNPWPKSCAGRHKHKKFIPIKQFSVKNLPKRNRDERLVEIIKLLSICTVRITVKKTDYLGLKTKLTNQLQTGTGTVIDVFNSETGSARIQIKTAFHVVSSDLEARNTTVDFFYDEEKSDKIRTLQGNCLGDSDSNEDWSIFECYTEDKKLAVFLKSNLDHYYDKSSLYKEASNLAIIVSHPHGFSKHVSVGEWRPSDKKVVGRKIKPMKRIRHNPEWNTSKKRNAVYQFQFLTLPCISFLPLQMSSSMAVIVLALFQPGYAFYDTSLYLYDTYQRSFPTMVNKNGQSEAVAIECNVQFPDDTESKCQIWRFNKPVNETKSLLMTEGGISGTVDDIYLELEFPEGSKQIMRDDKDMDYYWDALTCAVKIWMKRK